MRMVYPKELIASEPIQQLMFLIFPAFSDQDSLCLDKSIPHVGESTGDVGSYS